MTAIKEFSKTIEPGPGGTHILLAKGQKKVNLYPSMAELKENLKRPVLAGVWAQKNTGGTSSRLSNAKLLSKFNTPGLIRRRAKAIAETNAGRTKKSDDALASILAEFERLSF